MNTLSKKKIAMQKIKDAYNLAKDNDEIIRITFNDLKEIDFNNIIIKEEIKQFEMTYGISLNILSDIYNKYRYLYNDIIIKSDGTIIGSRNETDEEQKERICLIINKKLEEKKGNIK